MNKTTEGGVVKEELLHKLINDILPSLKEKIFALNDTMAKDPEIGSEEFKSSAAMVAMLEAAGIETEYPFCDLPTAFKAQIHPERSRRAALLAEYDALRGLGHACGHCASGSASLMAFLAMNEVADDLPFGLDLIGTPDEEIIGTKAIMANQGVFDGYDFVAMVHMGAQNNPDTAFIALDGLTIEFFGAPAHAAASPEEGKNALNAARLFFDATDMMRQHIVQEARLHGYVVSGGSASNIVPDYACVEFLTRAPQRAQLSDITNWVKDCVKAAALATRTNYRITPLGEPFHDLFISPAGRALQEKIFSDMDLAVDHKIKRSSGSSDIGNVDYICPAFHPYMSIGQDLGIHTLEFAQAMTDERTHQAIASSAQYLIRLCLELYFTPDILQEVQRQHKEYRGY